MRNIPPARDATACRPLCEPDKSCRPSANCDGIVEALNTGCHCVTLNRAALEAELGRQSGGLYRMIAEARPHLFSQSVLFVAEPHLRRMADIIAAVEKVTALPAYQERVLSWAPATARHFTPAAGAFLGYDFHLGEQGPQLIEVNTNPGGGLLNAVLARAQRACCDDVAALLPGRLQADALEQEFVRMFREEWRAVRGEVPLAAVAIVDTDPQAQYLLPEFVLFQHLFEQAGIHGVVCDPAELAWKGGRLRHGERAVDLVYNRLTDFALEAPQHAALREAWLADAVVLAPHPRAHAVHADKRNLAILSDAAALRTLGVDEETIALVLSAVPATEVVDPARGSDLWARRKQLFFKPAAGFGAKGAYRGDKLTRRVFEDILAGCYVAQALVPPSARWVAVDGQPVQLKVDLRNFVYRGQIQLVTARLYSGQTTNFRTPGGGFAPVLAVSCEEA